jgi:hypothetical protein
MPQPCRVGVSGTVGGQLLPEPLQARGPDDWRGRDKGKRRLGAEQASGPLNQGRRARGLGDWKGRAKVVKGGQAEVGPSESRQSAGLVPDLGYVTGCRRAESCGAGR